jgi:hypothetical protein
MQTYLPGQGYPPCSFIALLPLINEYEQKRCCLFSPRLSVCSGPTAGPDLTRSRGAP